MPHRRPPTVRGTCIMRCGKRGRNSGRPRPGKTRGSPCHFCRWWLLPSLPRCAGALVRLKLLQLLLARILNLLGFVRNVHQTLSRTLGASGQADGKSAGCVRPLDYATTSALYLRSFTSGFRPGKAVPFYSSLPSCVTQPLSAQGLSLDTQTASRNSTSLGLSRPALDRL